MPDETEPRWLLLIPIVGIFYLWRFAWRLALLPYRDWPPRPNEAAHWRKVSHPARPGARLYLVDRSDAPTEVTVPEDR